MKRKKPARQSLEDNLAELLAWVETCDQDRLNCDVKTEVGQDGKKVRIHGEIEAGFREISRYYD